MGSYLKELFDKEKALSDELDKEQEASLLKLVKRPDGAKEALEFQYENIDTLSTKTLEKYLGALSQYSIFITRYVNIINSKKKIAVSLYNRKLNEGFYLFSEELKTVKSITEKEIFVKLKDKELLELQDHLDTLDAKFALYGNVPDTINGLIQTIKKVYDARIRETIIQNNN